MLKPQYKLTNKIVKNLTDIAEAKGLIEKAKLLPRQELRLKRQAMIRMSHSSTAIEGNVLDIRQVEALYANKKIDAPARDVYEVQNYLNALKFIEKFVKSKKPITEKILLKIHSLVTNKTLSDDQSGHFREGSIYVVKRRPGFPDEVVYTGPKAINVPYLCTELIEWIRKSEKEEINPVIVAGVAHLEIAAIHPFNDGNGRTARALATLILYKRGYDFRHLFALEDYYNKDLPSYYKAINVGITFEQRRTDITSWLEYFVEGFKEEIMNVKREVARLALKKVDKNIASQIYLTQRQQQILDFIDQTGRIKVMDVVGILKVPQRTAQLELQKLKKLGTIKQVGRGPATSYVLK
ncbi:MAG: Fic family protein [Candidatus Moranbacteria bacterium]|nr:Fic family protein [Candidatus Moranbacteria bacterium]